MKVLTSGEYDQIETVGAVFNSLFPRVTTKYFLFLGSSVELSVFALDNSAGLLFHALENIPELDFVSGSILTEDRKLEIPCYRLLLCNHRKPILYVCLISFLWYHGVEQNISKCMG